VGGELEGGGGVVRLSGVFQHESHVEMCCPKGMFFSSCISLK